MPWRLRSSPAIRRWNAKPSSEWSKWCRVPRKWDSIRDRRQYTIGRRALDSSLPAEPWPVWGSIRDTRRTHKGMAPRGKEGRGPREWRQPRRSWEVVGQVCGTMLLRLGNRFHPPANVLGSDCVTNSERRGNIGASNSSNQFGRFWSG